MNSRCQRCGSGKTSKGKTFHDVVWYYCRNCGHHYSVYRWKCR